VLGGEAIVPIAPPSGSALGETTEGVQIENNEIDLETNVLL